MQARTGGVSAKVLIRGATYAIGPVEAPAVVSRRTQDSGQALRAAIGRG